MNGSGCKNCPVEMCETMNYRGSTCAAQRARYGLGDPVTNADRILFGSLNDLAEHGVYHCIPAGCCTFGWYGHFRGFAKSKEEAIQKEIEWLQQPAEGE